MRRKRIKNLKSQREIKHYIDPNELKGKDDKPS